jgi:hypothetical protein
MAETSNEGEIRGEIKDLFAVALTKYPDLFSYINSNQMSLFMEICDLIRPQIARSQPLYSGHTSPTTLPIAVQDFLQAALSHESPRVSSDDISFAWRALREVVWQKPVRQTEISIRAELLDLFLHYGPAYKIGEPSMTLSPAF